MTNRYKINGVDIFTAFGLMPKRGFYNELLKLPQRKEGYSKNWPDQHGTERDLNQVFFESRVINLYFIMKASSKEDFYSKYAALQTAVVTASRFDFDVIAMNRRFKLLYLNMSDFKKITMIENNNKIFIDISITVVDDFPVTNFPIV